jgi:hypothetical protein
LTNGTLSFNVTLKTAGLQTLTVSDSLNSNITDNLSGMTQSVPVYAQAPNPPGLR